MDRYGSVVTGIRDRRDYAVGMFGGPRGTIADVSADRVSTVVVRFPQERARGTRALFETGGHAVYATPLRGQVRSS